MCGGTRGARGAKSRPSGLSPRVRGNRQRSLGISQELWSIPACAGNLERGRGHQGRPGSIPACAGEPLAAPGSARRGRVYPRVCGGTPWFRALAARLSGLSPRVRGNLRVAAAARARGRSIPACAGEPRRYARTDRQGRVYPRVCGGTAVSRLSAAACSGLSPRVRGNRGFVGSSGAEAGSIPACAGEPSILAPLPRGAGVYPRVCGGTSLGMFYFQIREGLSPRVRGNRQPARPRTISVGSIPACAGEPTRSDSPSR